MSDASEDGYTGPAELIDGDRVVAVQATLAGHFDPISGSFSWYGRLSPADDPAGDSAADSAGLAALTSTPTTYTLRTPAGEARTRLSDLDPWQRPRVEGFGTPPFAVLTEIADPTV